MREILKTAIFLFTVVSISEIRADTITIIDIEDTYIVMNTDSTPDDRQTLIVEGYHCSACIDQRVLLKINLGMFSNSDKIDKAELMLYGTSQPRPGPGIVRVYKMTQNWLPAEASWYYASKAQKWSKAGGDFKATPYALFSFEPQVNNWHTYNVTSLIQEFIAKPDQNYGLMLKMDPTMVTVEYAFANASQVLYRPRLLVTYSKETSVVYSLRTRPDNAANVQVVGSQMRFQFSNNQEHSISFNSLNGKMLFSKTVTGSFSSIPLPKVAPGLYIIKTNGIEGQRMKIVSVPK